MRVNKGLLTKAELAAYETRLKTVKAAAVNQRITHLPNDDQSRLRAARGWYWGIGLTLTVVAGVVSGLMGGVVVLVPSTMGTAFMAGCMFSVAYLFQYSFANDRWVKDYLRGIGYFERTEAPQPPSRPASVAYDYDDHMSKRQRDHLWYGDHADLNWRDRKVSSLVRHSMVRLSV